MRKGVGLGTFEPLRVWPTPWGLTKSYDSRGEINSIVKCWSKIKSAFVFLEVGNLALGLLLETCSCWDVPAAGPLLSSHGKDCDRPDNQGHNNWEWADNKEEKWHDRLNRCRKSIYQTQQLFMIKMLNGLGIERKVLTLIKGIYRKSTAKHHSWWRKTMFSP